jgi:nitrate reductase cytochrome c-type subunit
MIKEPRVFRYLPRTLSLGLFFLVVVSACSHSDGSAQKKTTTQNATDSKSAQQSQETKQATDKNLVPYFNRPPVGTPIETH